MISLSFLRFDKSLSFCIVADSLGDPDLFSAHVMHIAVCVAVAVAVSASVSVSVSLRVQCAGSSPLINDSF